MSALLVFLLLVAGFVVLGNVLSGRRPRDHVYSFPVNDSPSTYASGDSGGDSTFDSDGCGDGGDSGCSD